ncbi:MAG: TonB-dependent receptor, partial [Sphingomonadales bacterium]
TGNALRNADRTLVYSAYPLINIANPNQVVPGPAGFNYGSNVYTGPVNLVANSGQQGEVTNYAAYLFDTMKLGKFELSGGVRWEKNSGWFRSDTAGAAATLTTPQGPITRGTRAYNKAEMFSYRAALAYKPIEAVTLYASYGNSKTPSQSSVNGSCVATGTSQTCNVKPEGAKIYEIGAKAELSGGRLLLSASAFRNERDSYRVASGDPLIPDQQLDGHSRVDGIALSAVGKITSAWSVTANYTYLKGKLIQTVTDECIASPTCSDPLAGARLANTPEHSGSIFTTYAFPFGLRLGYGATYQGSFDFATPNTFKSDAYWVHNAYVAYDFTPALTAQVNVKNVTDEEYYTRIRNNGWATPGDGRAAVLSVNYRF